MVIITVAFTTTGVDFITPVIMEARDTTPVPGIILAAPVTTQVQVPGEGVHC